MDWSDEIEQGKKRRRENRKFKKRNPFARELEEKKFAQQIKPTVPYKRERIKKEDITNEEYPNNRIFDPFADDEWGREG